MRYLIDFSYSGSNFFGYQKQPNKRTVQGELEKLLTSLNNSKEVKVYSAGRTDAKVNALHQKAHFDLSVKMTPYKLKGALNGRLPKDIYINDVQGVSDDFHARYMVKKKIYEYKINLGTYNPVLCNQMFQYCKPLDIKIMNESIQHLIGKHDFTTFVCAEDTKENKVRTIYKINIKKQKDILTITFCGDGFLKYQVRNMVGLLIKIGSGKENPGAIPSLIDAKDRRAIGITAPPEGLTLIDIKY